MMIPNSKLDVIGSSVAELITNLDRELWRGLEAQLWSRSAYKGQFGVHYFERQEEQAWERLILRCQTWDEVERVLNWHKMEWCRDGDRKIVTKDKILIFR